MVNPFYVGLLHMIIIMPIPSNKKPSSGDEFTSHAIELGGFRLPREFQIIQ